MGRVNGATFLGQDDEEKTQNQNQCKGSDGPNVLCFLKLKRQKKVGAAPIPSRNMRARYRIDALQAGARVII